MNFNPANWSWVNTLQGQNTPSTSQTVNSEYPTSMYYNPETSTVEKQQTDGSWSPLNSGNVLGTVTGSATGNNYAPAPVQAAPKPVLNQAAVNNTQGSIDELAGILQRALDAENQKYTDAETLFNEQQAGEQGRYDKGT